MTSPETRLAADSWRFSGESVAIRFNFAADSPAKGAAIATDSLAVRPLTTPDRY